MLSAYSSALSGSAYNNIGSLADFFKILRLCSAVTYGDGCIPIHHHHRRRLSDDKASAYHYSPFTRKLNTVMLHYHHSGFCSTRRKSCHISGKQTSDGGIRYAIHILCCVYVVSYQFLVQMCRQRPEHENPVNVVVFIHYLENIQHILRLTFFTHYIFFDMHAHRGSDFYRAVLVSYIAAVLTYSQNSQSRHDILFHEFFRQPCSFLLNHICHRFSFK